MSDAVLVREARALGIDARNARLLPLLPLVQLAWQGGEVPERRTIRRLLGERYELDALALGTVDAWFAAPPPAAHLIRARGLVIALVRRQRGRWVAPRTRAELLEVMFTVARGSASVFGLRRLVAGEEEALAEVLDALGPRGDEVWPEIRAGRADNSTWSDEEDDLDPPTDVAAMPPRPGPPSLPPRVVDAPRAQRVTLTRVEAAVSATAESGGSITLGRARGNTFQILDDGEVSRQHCRVYDRDGLWFVEDLGSMNGTYVDGDRVSLRQLRGGEELTIGHAIYRFVVEADTLTPFDDLLRD